MSGRPQPLPLALPLAPLEEHLGKRKSAGAAALAEGRARAPEFAALARAWGERLDRSAGVRAEEQLTAAALLQTLDAVALVDPVIAAAAAALAGAATAGPRGPHPALRICSSLAADALRAALAGTAADSTARFTAASQERTSGLLFPQGPEEELPTLGAVRSAFAPEALRLVALQGIDPAPLVWRAAAACEALLAGPPEENEALRLGALLQGLSARGAWTVTLLAAEPLAPLARWIETLAALAPAGQLQLALGEPLAGPAGYGSDRLFVELRLAGSQSDARLRKLSTAGLPALQLSIAPGALVEELVRWELALAFAGGAPWLLEQGAAPRGTDAAAKGLPGTGPGAASAARPSEAPALREGNLSIECAAAHARALRKVAGTLGPKAAMSVPHWLAAQLALQEPGDFVALHVCAQPTQALREALPRVQAAVRDATRLATRAVFDLGVLGPGALARAGGAAAGIYFLLSELGEGPEDAPARGEEERALALLGAAGRRALLLRSGGGDPAALVMALLQAAALLQR